MELHEGLSIGHVRIYIPLYVHMSKIKDVVDPTASLPPSFFCGEELQRIHVCATIGGHSTAELSQDI